MSHAKNSSRQLRTSTICETMKKIAVPLNGGWIAVPLQIIPYSTQEQRAQSRRPLRARALSFQGSHAITAIIAIITVVAIVLIISITAILSSPSSSCQDRQDRHDRIISIIAIISLLPSPPSRNRHEQQAVPSSSGLTSPGGTIVKNHI